MAKINLWTKAHLDKLLQEGKIKGYVIQNKQKLSQKVPELKQEPLPVKWIREQLTHFEKVLKYKIEEEYRFHPKRKWRFDFAIPELKIAIEYEGIQSQKSRHTTLTGYTGDAEKYNEAQRRKWTVLRYTIINYESVVTDVKNIIHDRIIGQYLGKKKENYLSPAAHGRRYQGQVSTVYH